MTTPAASLYYNNGGVGSWTGLSFDDSAFATYVLVPPPAGTGRSRLLGGCR